MSEEKPTPDDVPDELVDRIENESPAVLRAIAGYATELAEARADEETPHESSEPDAPGEASNDAPGEASKRPSDAANDRANDAVTDVDTDGPGSAGAVDDERAEIDDGAAVTTTDGDDAIPEDGERPDGVPGKASITVKEINENRYYYWQWRDGDTVKSKYHGPVDSIS